MKRLTASFDAVFQAAGTTIMRTAVEAPRINAVCERLIGILRRELPVFNGLINEYERAALNREGPGQSRNHIFERHKRHD